MNGELPTSVLKSIIWGDDLELDDSDPENEPNPFEQLEHDGAVRAALGKSNGASVVLDLALPPESDVDDDSTSPFYKSPVIVQDGGRRTLKKRLGITRSEEVKGADGSVWLHGFDANNQLVDARLIESAE
jgi:hypothetical protein